MKIKKTTQKTKQIHTVAHARIQKGGLSEEAEIGRTITTFLFLTCALGAPMTDYPPDAVSAAEPLCTHVKDHPGLRPHHSLKLLRTINVVIS